MNTNYELTDQALKRELKATRSQIFAACLLKDGDDWRTQLGTNELAAAAAQLDIEIGEDEARIKLKKKRLDEACAVLGERFTNEATDRLVVETTDGKKLVHQVVKTYVNVLAEARPRVLDWLKIHAPHLVGEAYNDQSFKAFVRKAESDGDGEFPTELVDAKDVRIYKETDIEFRVSK